MAHLLVADITAQLSLLSVLACPYTLLDALRLNLVSLHKVTLKHGYKPKPKQMQRADCTMYIFHFEWMNL